MRDTKTHPMFWFCDCPAGQDMQSWYREECPHCGATRDGRTNRSAQRYAVWKDARARRPIRVVTATRAMAIEF